MPPRPSLVKAFSDSKVQITISMINITWYIFDFMNSPRSSFEYSASPVINKLVLKEPYHFLEPMGTLMELMNWSSDINVLII